MDAFFWQLNVSFVYKKDSEKERKGVRNNESREKMRFCTIKKLYETRYVLLICFWNMWLKNVVISP